MRACPICRLRYSHDETHCLVDGAELAELSDPRLGSELGGRYRLDEVLGRGGMATVYRARQWRLGTDVAIKVLHSRFADDEVARTRLEREAAAAAQLSHPNIVEMFDVGQTDDQVPYVAMELLDGETLHHHMQRKGALPVSEVVALALQIARGLSRAHDFDVIHRDIKPENIFVCKSDDSQPVVKLVDFGIALVASAPRLTAGDFIGSPRYMAPERFKNRAQALPRSDLYSLGVVMFEMATGQLPFTSESMAGFVLHHMETVPPRLGTLIQCPTKLEALVAELLAKAPEDRPLDAHIVVARLSELASERAKRVRHVSALTTGRMSSSPSPIQTWRHRSKVYREMSKRAFGLHAPGEIGAWLDAFERAVDRLEILDAEGRKLEAELSKRVEKLKTDRERVGHAVETLGKDFSAGRGAEAGIAHGRAYQSCLAKLIDLDMRSPDNPTTDALDLLKQACLEYEKWLGARKASGASDLEFQLAALRERLERLEKESSEERARANATLETQGEERKRLEAELIALSQQLGAAFRPRAEVSDLFVQLRQG